MRRPAALEERVPQRQGEKFGRWNFCVYGGQLDYLFQPSLPQPQRFEGSTASRPSLAAPLPGADLPRCST